MTENGTLTLQDVSGALSFLWFRGIHQIRFRKEPSGRVVADVPATPEVYQILGEFQTNPTVSLNDFLACQRRVRGMMLDLREGENGRRHGWRMDDENSR